MHMRVTDLPEMLAKDLSSEDYILVADVYSKKENGKVSKRMQVRELMKYIREHLSNYEP